MKGSSTIVNIKTGPFAAGSTPIYTGHLIDGDGNPIPGSALNTMVLSIVDTARATFINGVDHVNILNADRGAIDESGNITISFRIGDTAIEQAPENITKVQRSLSIEWTYNSGQSAGGHQVNFDLVELAGDT